MLQQSIYLQDVLQEMKTLDADGRAVPFSIKFRTFNRYSKTGGRLVYYPKAKLIMKEENPNANSIDSLRTVSKPRPKTRKNPNHFENKTRNIRVLPQGDPKKIHIRFITEFNNQKVIY